MTEKAKKKFNLGQFVREIRMESGKATWPGRKEVGVTTAMVIWLTIIASLFLFSVDWVIQHLVRGVLNLFA
jgi:preprotein translocase subunit SecE